MSANTLESLLYKIANDPAVTAEFAANPQAVLDRFPLSAVERNYILTWDLHALIAAGVSPMLLNFGYVTANGGLQARDEYIRVLKSPPRSQAATMRQPNGE